ncbi:MAG: tRNA pseudouridine(38-40) synthase TruA [Desulfobacteraceae bacterium]|nr:tRNA pseudouridine(38-40) synthase TruA [Desulfobacteraceae bacterium]
MTGERNIRLLLAFDGTGYAGWQRQKDLPTVQGVLEEKIAVMTGGPVTLHGAGRTDAGVHALGMVANFATNSAIPCSGFFRGLNSLLPEDIRILNASEAPPDFHARFSATGKCYLYEMTMGEVPLPTERLYRTHLDHTLCLEEVRRCLDLLVGRHDFSSFEATGSRDPANGNGLGAVREIYAAALCHVPGGTEKLQVSISGNGFLRHMVRNIVGTLVEVGQGRRSVESFAHLFEIRDRSAAGPTMPAKGLFLKEVYYA